MRSSTELFRNGKAFQVRVLKPLLADLKWTHRDDLLAEVATDQSLRLQTLERYVQDRVARGTAALGRKHATTRLMKSGSSLHVNIPRTLLELLGWQDREALILVTDDDSSLVIQTFERYMQAQITADRHARAAVDAGAPA